jgi:xanthine dehydrogenase molybdopterin-binding subunit B
VKNETMKRYLIDRDIPNVGSRSREQFKGLAATSNDALVKLSGKVQWVHSYIAADRTFCVYLAESEVEHSRLAGFPITRVNEVPTVIGSMTASDQVPLGRRR